MILVTGGAGFIGSNFIKEYLKNKNERIVNYDNKNIILSIGEYRSRYKAQEDDNVFGKY